MQDGFKHVPRERDLVHDLAKHFEAQKHVEQYFWVVGQDLILGDHLVVEALVKLFLFSLNFDVFDALFQSWVLAYPLQGLVVGY